MNCKLVVLIVCLLAYVGLYVTMGLLAGNINELEDKSMVVPSWAKPMLLANMFAIIIPIALLAIWGARRKRDGNPIEEIEE